MAEDLKGRFAIVVVVLFLISGWYSFQELRYAVWGRTVPATVTNVEHRQERVYRRRYGSRTREVTDITVQFAGADNTPQIGEITESGVSRVHPQQQLSIQYIPSKTDMIRLGNQQNWIALIFFFGGTVAMVGTLVWVGMEANRPFGEGRSRSDDRPVRAVVPKKKKRALKPLKPIDD